MRRALVHVLVPQTNHVSHPAPVPPLLSIVRVQACSCKMDLEHSVGSIMCDNCGAKYSMRINRLTEAIDVYSEWIDSAWLPRAMLFYKPALPFHAQPCVCVLRALTCAASTRASRTVSEAVNAPGGNVAPSSSGGGRPREEAEEEAEEDL